MSFYDVKGKYAVVTGAGSGICHALTVMLLEKGCSVVMADLRLRPEAEATLKQHSHPPKEPNAPSAVFHKTDMGDWTQINSLWEVALKTFGRVDIVLNGAATYEPPSSTFWNPPSISPLAEDAADATIGQYKTLAVNTVGPIRLAQIAIDYWLENRDIQGNLLCIASLGAYVPSFLTPIYIASKAAIVGFVTSLGALRTRLGIRNSAVCPGAVYTPIFYPEYCRDRLRPDDLALTPQQCAAVIMQVLQEPQYGDGNIVEVMLLGSKGNSSLNVREVPLQALYPQIVPTGEDNNVLEEGKKLLKLLQEKGMRA